MNSNDAFNALAIAITDLNSMIANNSITESHFDDIIAPFANDETAFDSYALDALYNIYDAYLDAIFA